MFKILLFYLLYMYVYIYVVIILLKIYFLYIRYYWFFGEVFLLISKLKWFLNFNMYGVCFVVCGMFFVFNKIWIF